VRRVVLALAIVLCLPQAAQARPRVVVVGDSLTQGTAPHLGGDFRYRVDARRGRATAEGLRVLSGMPHRRMLVLALGTNDGPNDLAVTRRMVSTGLSHVGAGGCMVTYTLFDSHRAHDRQNRWLRKRSSGARRIALVDWASHLRRHPNLLAGDGVHATASGYRVRARLTMRALGQCRTRLGL
jgi:lysophospholipase L1-like esterase